MILGAMLVAWSGIVCAAGEGSATNAPPKREAPKGTPMDCELVQASADGKSIEVKGADGKTQTLVLSDSCKVWKNGAKASLTDLKPGEKCHCKVYDRKDGTKSVGVIRVGEEKAKKPAAAN